MAIHTNTPACFACGAAARFRCASCKYAHYCSKECQRAHWVGGHKHAHAVPAAVGEGVLSVGVLPSFASVLQGLGSGADVVLPGETMRELMARVPWAALRGVLTVSSAAATYSVAGAREAMRVAADVTAALVAAGGDAFASVLPRLSGVLTWLQRKIADVVLAMSQSLRNAARHVVDFLRGIVAYLVRALVSTAGALADAAKTAVTADNIKAVLGATKRGTVYLFTVLLDMVEEIVVRMSTGVYTSIAGYADAVHAATQAFVDDWGGEHPVLSRVITAFASVVGIFFVVPTLLLRAALVAFLSFVTAVGPGVLVAVVTWADTVAEAIGASGEAFMEMVYANAGADEAEPPEEDDGGDGEAGATSIHDVLRGKRRLDEAFAHAGNSGVLWRARIVLAILDRSDMSPQDRAAIRAAIADAVGRRQLYVGIAQKRGAGTGDGGRRQRAKVDMSAVRPTPRWYQKRYVWVGTTFVIAAGAASWMWWTWGGVLWDGLPILATKKWLDESAGGGGGSETLRPIWEYLRTNVDEFTRAVRGNEDARLAFVDVVQAHVGEESRVFVPGAVMGACHTLGASVNAAADAAKTHVAEMVASANDIMSTTLPKQLRYIPVRTLSATMTTLTRSFGEVFGNTGTPLADWIIRALSTAAPVALTTSAAAVSLAEAVLGAAVIWAITWLASKTGDWFGAHENWVMQKIAALLRVAVVASHAAADFVAMRGIAVNLYVFVHQIGYDSGLDAVAVSAITDMIIASRTTLELNRWWHHRAE